MSLHLAYVLSYSNFFGLLATDEHGPFKVAPSSRAGVSAILTKKGQFENESDGIITRELISINQKTDTKSAMLRADLEPAKTHSESFTRRRYRSVRGCQRLSFVCSSGSLSRERRFAGPIQRARRSFPTTSPPSPQTLLKAPRSLLK